MAAVDLVEKVIRGEEGDVRSESPVAHELMPRRFKNYILSETELTFLGSLTTIATVLCTLFGVAAGAMITTKGTLDTLPISDVQTHANYYAAFLVSCGFTVVCGVCAAVVVAGTFSSVRRIKKHSEQEKQRRDLAGSQPLFKEEADLEH